MVALDKNTAEWRSGDPVPGLKENFGQPEKVEWRSGGLSMIPDTRLIFGWVCFFPMEILELVCKVTFAFCFEIIQLSVLA